MRSGSHFSFTFLQAISQLGPRHAEQASGGSQIAA
jgi:hypothetical protein